MLTINKLTYSVVEKIPDELFEEYFESSRQLTTIFMKEIRDCLSVITDLPHAEVMVLKILKKEGPLSQNEIAKELCHTDASISKLVGSLEDQKLVSANVDQENRRRLLVEITAQGKRTLSRVEKSLLEEIRNFYTGVTKEKLTELISFNKNLTNNILDQKKES